MSTSNQSSATAATSSDSTRAIVEGATRMSGFDFATWRSASDDPVMRSTMIGLIVLDQAPDWRRLRERYDRTSRVNTILRKKVVEGPIGLATPRLVIDPHFDLSFHLRRYEMPTGATWADVLEDARRQSMTDFDKDRPLWKVTLLEGLPDGKAILLMKLHHAIADGQGAVLLGALLFDFSPEGMELGPMPAEPVGEDLTQVDFARKIVKDNLGWYAKSTQELISGFAPATLKALRHPRKILTKAAKTAASVAKVASVPLGPLSPLMKDRSINYHFGAFDVPLRNVKEVAHANGHTVNDVFLAAVSEGMAKFHLSEGHLISRLRINMPISLRKTGDSIENAVTIARFEMPIRAEGTEKLMDEVSDIVKKWRNEPALALTEQLADLSRVLPVELLSAAAQASDVTASNVPGVPIPVWLAGAKVLRMYPLVGTIGAAVNITMLTYNGIASVGVSSDDAAVKDYHGLLSSLRAGFAEATGKPVPDATPFGEVAPEPPMPEPKQSARKIVAEKLAPRRVANRAKAVKLEAAAEVESAASQAVAQAAVVKEAVAEQLAAPKAAVKEAVAVPKAVFKQAVAAAQEEVVEAVALD